MGRLLETGSRPSVMDYHTGSRPIIEPSTHKSSKNFLCNTFLNWGVPAPECLVLGSPMCEVDGGRERGGPKGSGNPLTFMALIFWLLLLLLLLGEVMLFVLPRDAESYRECRLSGSLLFRTGSRSRSRGGWTELTGVIPTGGKLVLEPAS